MTANFICTPLVKKAFFAAFIEDDISDDELEVLKELIENLKKVFFIMLVAALLLTGCAKPESNNIIKADDLSIYYGASSHALFSTDQSVIDDLLNRFNSLSFEKTTDEIDLMSAFHISFSYNGNRVDGFWVDKNGVFWLDGDDESQCYKVSSGSFDYQHLKTIYKDSKTSP